MTTEVRPDRPGAAVSGCPMLEPIVRSWLTYQCEMIPRVEQIRTHLLTARILQHSTEVDDMLENRDAATSQFDEIKAFTVKLIERAKFNKNMVLLLAGLLIAFGLLMLAYRKWVLDVQFPWQPYEGPPEQGSGG